MNDVRHDGNGTLQVRFAYDRDLVDLIKTLPHRRWNATERLWTVPEQDVLRLADLLHERGFTFDDATRDLYRSLGGSRTLRGAAAAPADAITAPRLPGLFDTEEPGPDAAAAAPTDLTVSGLNQLVRRVLEDAFPDAFWLVGEISGFNRGTHRRIVGFELIERGPDGQTRSAVAATLFEQERRAIERALARAGDPFRFEDEVEVRVLARVELYVPWGSYRVIVQDLDVNYTLGEAARRREEIIRRLTAEGLTTLNTALPLPALPLRVGLVTSLGSDACNDVLHTLRESGFAFGVTVHGARVQGRGTEPSVLNALDRLREMQDRLDVVLICRGGGSRTDLAWFDSEALGRAVATFPLPVVVGIGHEQDYSVLDAVARRCKTPTAAAALLVETVTRSLARFEELARSVPALAVRRLVVERARGVERGRRLGLAVRGLLEREAVELGHRRERTIRGARSHLARASEGLGRGVRRLPRLTAVHFARQRQILVTSRRAVVAGARRDVTAAALRVEELGHGLAPRAQRRLAREVERTTSRERRLDLVSPRRVLERGYAILRREAGGVLTDAEGAPAGTRLTAELRRGTLGLRSEGPSAPRGD